MVQVQRLGSGESPMDRDEEAAASGACAGEHWVGRRRIRAGWRSGAVGGSTGQPPMGSGREQGCSGRVGLACGARKGEERGSARWKRGVGIGLRGKDGGRA